MPYTVQVGEDNVEFPDSVTPDQARDILRKRFKVGGSATPSPSPLKQAVQESKQVDNRSFWEKVGSSEGGFQNPAESPVVAEQMGKESRQGLTQAASLGAGIGAAEVYPVVAGGGALLRGLGLLGRAGAAGAAQQATEEALSGFQPGNESRIRQAEAIGAGLGAGGALLERYGPTAYQYARNAFNPRAAATTAFRPFAKPSPSQLSADSARRAIEDTTGIDVPVGVGEAIGTPELANNIKNIQSGAELSPEAKDAIKRQVVFAATQLRNSGIAEQDLAQATVDTLRQHIGAISQPAKDAVAAAAKELHPAIKQAFDQVQNDALALVPGTAATSTQAGNRIRGAIQGTFEDLSNAEKDAFQKALSNPDYAAVSIPTGETQKWLDNLEWKTVQLTRSGSNATAPASGAYPQGVSPYAAIVGDLAPNQSLEAMRNLRTKVGNSIGNDTIFPGVSSGEKKQLYKAISADIDAGIGSLPNSTLKTDLQQASALTKQKYSTFDNPMMSKILRDFGAEGGADPASIVSKLRSKSGPSFLAELRSAVPPNRAKEITDASAEFLFNDIGNAAKDPVSGTLSAGKLLNGISDLQPEIRDEFFPNYGKIVDLAKKQKALSEVDPGKIIRTLSVEDPALLFDALGPNASKSVMDKVSDAFAKSQALQEQFNGTVIGALNKADADGLSEAVQKNPTQFMDSILDGKTFSPKQVDLAIRTIASHNPALINDLQFNFVNDLLSKSSGQGRISANNLLKAIQSETPIGKAGPLRGIAESVLGAGKTSTLETTLQSLSEIEKAGGDLSPSSPLIDLLARGAGAAVGSAVRGTTGIGTIGAANELASIASRSQKIKYALASYILTTPELRKLAITPINRFDPVAAKQLINGFSSFVIGKYGPDSPEADEIHSMNIEANRRAK